MAINKLSSIDTVVGGDQLPIGSQNNGGDRKIPISLLLEYMQDNLTFSDAGAFTTQYSAPSATAFNVSITDGSDSIHLILTPTAGFADGTITLPSVLSLEDKQEVLVNCTQVVTTLVVDGNGATAVTGEPSTLAANDFFKLKYDLATKTWYRVG